VGFVGASAQAARQKRTSSPSARSLKCWLFTGGVFSDIVLHARRANNWVHRMILSGSSPMQRDSMTLTERRRQQRHIYLEIMGSMPLKIMLLTMIATAVGCIVLSVMQSKNLSEIVGYDQECIRQLGKDLCIAQFEPLNCTPPNSSFFVPPSNFKGKMTGISPYNRYFAIDTRFQSPNSNTTRNAQKLIFPQLTFNMTVLASDRPVDVYDVVFEAKRQM
jgi:hypothetical protein